MVVLTTIVGGITQIPHGPHEPPYYASTPQSPQPPQSIPPFEQAILDLTQIVDGFVAEQKGINAHSNQRIVTVEDNLNEKLDGLKNDFEHKWDNLQDSMKTSSISSNVHQRKSTKVTPGRGAVSTTTTPGAYRGFY